MSLCPTTTGLPSNRLGLVLLGSAPPGAGAGRPTAPGSVAVPPCSPLERPQPLPTVLPRPTPPVREGGVAARRGGESPLVLFPKASEGAERAHRIDSDAGLEAVLRSEHGHHRLRVRHSVSQHGWSAVEQPSLGGRVPKTFRRLGTNHAPHSSATSSFHSLDDRPCRGGV